MNRPKLIWVKTETGLIVPDGTASNIVEHNRHTYLSIKNKAEQLEYLYAGHEIRIPPGSSLDTLIQSAKRLSDAYLCAQTDQLPIDVLFNTLHLHRVADAILMLSDNTACRDYLIKLTSGSLDLLQRTVSTAKNFLWEIELYSILRKHGFIPEIQEPDIKINVGKNKIVFACKKIYSEKNLGKTISKGVAQIEKAKLPGIIALNIDDLLPQHQILNTQTNSEMGISITHINNEFISKHDYYLRKYLSTSRIVACLVSANLIVDVKEGNPRMNNASQITFWNIPSLSKQRQELINEFYSNFNS